MHRLDKRTESYIKAHLVIFSIKASIKKIKKQKTRQTSHRDRATVVGCGNFSK